MQIRRISVHQQLRQPATCRAISLNALALEVLEAYMEAASEEQEHFAPRELSALLAPATEAAHLTEEELLRHACQMRQRI